MSKKELIQIRVSEDEKLKIKTIARKKGMTISEFILYSLMRTISEYEIYELIKKWKNFFWLWVIWNKCDRNVIWKLNNKALDKDVIIILSYR